MVSSKLNNFLNEMPYAVIGDGEQTREAMDFFYELDGVDVAVSKGSKETFVWDWIEEFCNFFKDKRWRFVNKMAKPHYFVDGTQYESYSKKEMKEWVDSICRDSIFINIMKVSLANETRKKKFMDNKFVPEEIKSAVFPNEFKY